jgi:hypothetical protein
MKKNKTAIFFFLLLLNFACEYEVSVDHTASNENTVSANDKNQKRTDIEFTAQSESVVEVGEVFQLSYTVNERVENFTPPEFENFDVSAGPFTSSSSSTQIINGKGTQAVKVSYIYNISAQRPGTFTIPPANAQINGHKYQSNTLNIKVIGESQYTNEQTNEAHVKKITEEGNIFISTDYSATKVYPGEYIVVTTKLYTLVDFQNISELKFPDYKGFWSEILKAPRQLEFNNEIINGKKYKSALLKQVLLFSQTPGNFTISPYEIEIQLKKKDGETKDFFGNIVDNYKLINKKLTTKSQTITVNPLPQPIPENFSGISGNKLSVKAETYQSIIKTDESTNLKISISGSGNLHLLNDLKLNLPEGIEHFDPQIEKTEKFSENGAFGERIFNYIIVGNKPGDYTIEPFEFVYFDTENYEYKIIKSNELNLKVIKSSDELPVNELQAQNNQKDIRFIKTSNLKLNKTGNRFVGSLFYYLIYLITFSVFIAGLFARKKYIEANSNKIIMKKKNAGKVSQQRLKTALKYMTENNQTAFYKEILNAIWGYLSDKMSVNADLLTNEKINELLNEHKAPDELISNLSNIITTCGYAQYSPTGTEYAPENIYKELTEIINELETIL